LVDWHVGIGTKYERAEYDSLSAALKALLPLTNAKTRRLYVPTSTPWTACFQNGIQGSDPFPAMSFLAGKLGVLAMRICHAPQDGFPAIVWEVYAPESLGGVPPLGYRRSIAVVNDGGRWVFEHSGEPFVFEDLSAYRAKRKRDRFTTGMLSNYLRTGFKLDVFNEGIYGVSRTAPAIVLRQITNLYQSPEYTLDEVKAGVPWRS
jgi:hypothetical protein